MSLNCGVTQASGGDSQPNSPTDMVSSMTQSQMKNFLTLKNKIIRTDDLIKRHKDVLSQLTETQTRLVSTEKGARGLKAELHVLHQEKRKLVASLTMLREEVASLGDSKREEEQLVQQLKAKLDILERKNKQYEKKAGNAQGLLDKKEKWKNMYQKLKREHKSYRSRTNSRKNSPMCPLVSPPYLSSSEELTPPTPSPPITFTVEETKKKTVVREELFVNESRCLGVEYSLEDYMVPIQMEHSPEDATEATKKKCAILKMPEFLLPPEKMPQPEVNTEKANVDSFNGDIHVNSPEDATEATKNKCAILNMPEFLLPPKKMSQPEVNTEKANVDSFDDDMVPKHSPEDAIEATKNKCALNMPEFLLPPKKILQLEVNTEKANVNSFVQDELVSAKDITDHAPIHVQDVMVAKRLEVTDPEHSITCPHICERLRSPTVAPPLSLSNQLFGDSDSDDALSVSDDSSDDEHDDLAEMLESETTTPKDNDITNKPASSINKKNVANITTVGSAADDEVSTLPMEDCNISISETNVNSIITTEVIVAEEEQMATGHVSSMTEGSNFIVPCVEVESVAADTLSSEDEMDVSFNEGSVFVLSPLPQSPIDMDAHDRSLDTPLSPLPISPTNELPLSPLPQSPVQSHDDDEDMTLSPLPPSPIQSHNDNEDITLSPLPPSPINFRLHSGVISPLPNSPVSAPGSKVITPLPASPVSVRRLTNLAPLNFADTAPCGVQAPTPCNVVVMVTSQSEEYRETTPTRSELVLSDGSPFSPPPLFIDSTKYCELVSSYCEETQNAAKATVTVDTLDLSASGDVDNGGYSSDSDKVPFIGPVLPPAHPLNNIPIAPPIDTPSSIDSQNYSTLTVPTATSIPLNDKYKLDHSTRSSTRSATNNQNSTNKQLPGGNTKKKKGKINPFQKPVPKNNSNSTSFDDLLQSFRQTSQVTNPAPRVVSNTQQTSQVKNPTPRVVSNMRQPSQVTNPAPPAASNTHQHTLKQDRRISASVEVPPSSKRPRLTSSTSSTSSTVSSTPLLCSQLPRATPVQALPGYQGDSPTDTSTSKGTFPPCYRLRSRKVDFFETVKRRKKSSSCSDDSLSNETPVREGNSDSISVPQGIHGDAILSDGELSESEEEKSNQKPPPVSMITRKRRHTDGATGQEEDQTPSSSPLQLLAPPTLLQSDLSHVNCGYGKKETEVSQTKAATQTQSVDDIFSTNLPLLGQSKLSLATPTVTPIQHSGLSIVQQQLPVWLNCPLPLPDWLVAAMVGLPGLMNKSHANVVNTPNVGGKKKKKRTFVVKDPIQRQSSQKPSAFILANLERLVLGQIYLSAIIPMLSDLKHISSSSVLIKAIIEFLLHHYMPSVDVVVKLYHDQCDSVRTSPHDCQPLNPSFPPALLKPECQLLALFVHLPRMNSNMATFLSELSTALYQTIVTPGMKFHQLAAAVRLFTGVCRLQGDSERVLFMCFDLVRKPLLVNELLVISGVASVWPLPLARYSGLIVQSDGIPEVKELEKQTLCFTLETVIMTMVKEKASKLNSSLSPHMHTLCGWVHVSDNTVNLLTEKLLHMLNTSSAVYIDQPPPPPSPWRRPRPSVQAFHIVHSLRLLSYSRGWVWTNDTLIRAHLWPILKKWNSSEGSEVKDAAAVCVVRLIGFVSSQGVTADPLSSSISQLQRVLIALLSKSTPGGFSALQLAAVDSLLELCPPAHPRAAEAVGVVRVWLNGLCKHAVNSLAKEFNERLLVYRVGS